MVYVYGEDSGSAVDTEGLAAQVTDSDTGSGVDQGTVPQVYLLSSDGVTTTDVNSIAAALSGSDTGSAVDLWIFPVTSSDIGSGSESHSIQIVTTTSLAIQTAGFQAHWKAEMNANMTIGVTNFQSAWEISEVENTSIMSIDFQARWKENEFRRDYT